MKILYNHIPSKLQLHRLEEYIECTIDKKWLISPDEGVFSVDREGIYKLKFIDKNYEVLSNDFIIDFSYISKEKAFKIPFDCFESNYKLSIYSLRPNSKLKLHIEHSEDIIQNIYFITNEHVEQAMVQEDLNSFFSIVK